MRIALCDDQRKVCVELNELLQRYNDEKNIQNKFMYFEKPSELYEYMLENVVDIIFMELDFGDEAEDGILWLKKIHKHFPHTISIILTNDTKRYKEGYEARVFRFMTKPIEEKELYAYLDASLEELQLTQSISLTRRGITYPILVQDVFYLSAHFGGSELWTKSDAFLCEESLLQWENRLPVDMFFRCHSKYVVNLAHITGFDKQMLTLENGEKIPISRRRWKAFQLAYMKFDTKDYRL